MLTRKYYEMIAETIRKDAAHIVTDRAGNETREPYAKMSLWSKGAYDQWNTLVLAFADALARDNPAFDRARFLQACGVAS